MTTKNLLLALTGFLMILAAVSNTRDATTEPFTDSVASFLSSTTSAIPGIGDVTAAGNGVSVRLAADQTRVLASDTTGALMVEVIGQEDAANDRTPVAIALVIDTSGSMAGDKIEQARVAAARLVSQLENGDLLTVVTYGRSADTIIRAEELGEDRSRILSQIRGISTAGNTCMSCGMEVAYTLLSDAPAGHVRRAVVLSDGQANQGISSPDGLANLASHAGDDGTVTATIGLGSDYNEVLMAAVATAGTGAYYFMPDATAMASILERELDALSNTVARDLYVTVRANGDALLVAADIAGAAATKDGVRIHVRQLAGGEIRRFVIPVDYTAGIDSVFHADVDYLDTDGVRTSLTAQVAVEETDDSAVAEATIHADVVTHSELARAVVDIERAMEDAIAGRSDDAVAELDRLAGALEGMGASIGSEELSDEAENVRALQDRVAAPSFSGRGEEGRNLMLQNAARSTEMQSGVAREQMYHDSTVY